MKVPAAFYNVSPYWAKAIGAAKTVRSLAGYEGKDSRGEYNETTSEDGMHNLKDAASCIVGEAYGMSDKYWDRRVAEEQCSTCGNYSKKFYNILVGDYDSVGNRKQLVQDNIQGFTKHWRDEHDPLIGVVPDVDIQADEQLADQIKAKH